MLKHIICKKKETCYYINLISTYLQSLSSTSTVAGLYVGITVVMTLVIALCTLFAVVRHCHLNAEQLHSNVIGTKNVSPNVLATGNSLLKSKKKVKINRQNLQKRMLASKVMKYWQMFINNIRSAEAEIHNLVSPIVANQLYQQFTKPNNQLEVVCSLALGENKPNISIPKNFAILNTLRHEIYKIFK